MESLKPPKDPFNATHEPEDERYVFVGCEDIPGFEAVALGEKARWPDLPALVLLGFQDFV